MNWERMEGNWGEAKGKLREQWDRLSDDHLNHIAGRRDQLVGSIQEFYGVSKETAEDQVKEWEMDNREMFNIVPRY